jgi:CheY-like chemotaxis protein
MSSTGNAAVQVLVVEDQALIRMETREVIEEAGFTVYEACNADEAIELLAAHSDIALIFTDVDMPGSMDGVKLAHYVRKRWPPVKIIVTSGFKAVTLGDLPNGGLFLSKPYAPEQLKRKLEFLFNRSLRSSLRPEAGCGSPGRSMPRWYRRCSRHSPRPSGVDDLRSYRRAGVVGDGAHRHEEGLCEPVAAGTGSIASRPAVRASVLLPGTPRQRKRSETGAFRRQGFSWIGMVLIRSVSALCLDLGRALLTS